MLGAAAADREIRKLMESSVLSANKPDFLLVGPTKTATTSLAYTLMQHPDLLCPDHKRLNYFDRHFDRGL